MSSTVVNQRIKVSHLYGFPHLGDYTGMANAEGAPHGRGSYVGVEEGLDGDSYDGLFTHGQRNGFGKYTQSGGSWYAGEWKADKFEGYGRGHVCVVFVWLVLTVLGVLV